MYAPALGEEKPTRGLEKVDPDVSEIPVVIEPRHRSFLGFGFLLKCRAAPPPIECRRHIPPWSDSAVFVGRSLRPNRRHGIASAHSMYLQWSPLRRSVVGRVAQTSNVDDHADARRRWPARSSRAKEWNGTWLACESQNAVNTSTPRAAAIAATSRTRRLLPMPGGPTTPTTPPWPSAARSNRPSTANISHRRAVLAALST